MATQVGNNDLYPDLKTSEFPGIPLSTMPRSSPVLFPEDKLPRPAVIDVAGSYASSTDSATAIKEILSSVLNLPSSFKSSWSLKKHLQERDLENDEDCYTSDEESDGDHDSIPLMATAQNDIRFHRHTAVWDNSQMDSPDTSPVGSLDTPPVGLLAPLESALGRPRLESPHYLKCNDCSRIILPGSEFVSPLNLHVKLSKENRRFSSPSIGPHGYNPNRHNLNLEQFALRLNEAAGVSDASTGDKTLHRRSASCSNIFKVPGTSPQSAGSLFEPTIDVEKENEHFLVADLFISLVEVMKSSCQHEQWVPQEGTRRLKKDPEETDSGRKKTNSESAISTDSGYEGLAAAQSSPVDTIFEEEEYRCFPNYKCITIHKDSATPESIDDEDDDYDEDYYVLIEMEELEEETAKKESDPPTERTEPVVSNTAEQTAINLYRTFRQQWNGVDEDAQCPATATIDCLSCKHTIPEELESSGSLVEEIKLLKIREAEDWSPPRFQIITTEPPNDKRDTVVASQNFKCFGCGTRLEPKYTNRLRYCHYLGKYFCDCCHHYSGSPIPGRIFTKWNFGDYYVSNFAKTIVNRIWDSHLFNVQTTNPTLYKKVKDLERIKEVQQQLIHIRKLVMTCRFSYDVVKAFEEFPSHLTRELHLFTLEDLHQVRQRTLLPGLRELLALSVAHVGECPLCQARGFFCEFCRHCDVIFPFQTEIVRRCEDCKACYHKECFKTNQDCPKCLRIKAREALINDLTSSGEVDPCSTAQLQ